MTDRQRAARSLRMQGLGFYEAAYPETWMLPKALARFAKPLALSDAAMPRFMGQDRTSMNVLPIEHLRKLRRDVDDAIVAPLGTSAEHDAAGREVPDEILAEASDSL